MAFSSELQICIIRRMKAKYPPSPPFHICWQTLDKLHTKLVFGHLHILKWVLYFGHYSCINFRRGITVSEKKFCIRLDQNGPAANRAFSNFCSSVSKSGSTSTLDSLLPEFWCLRRRGLAPFCCIGDTSFLHLCKSCSVISGSFKTLLAALLT